MQRPGNGVWAIACIAAVSARGSGCGTDGDGNSGCVATVGALLITNIMLSTRKNYKASYASNMFQDAIGIYGLERCRQVGFRGFGVCFAGSLPRILPPCAAECPGTAGRSYRALQ